MRTILNFLLVASVTFCVGCSESTDATVAKNTGASEAENTAQPGFTAVRPSEQYDDPRQAVSDFLIAVKSGDEETATSLLTTDAQKEAWTNGLAISGDGFPDAKFDVSEVEYLQEKTVAHVMSTWSDKTPYGENKSFQCVWLLRHESHGWCIYGMATKFLEHLQPIVLNFENQAEMQRKQQWAEQQIIKHRELELHQQQAVTQGPPQDQRRAQQPGPASVNQQPVRQQSVQQQATRPQAATTVRQ